MEIRGDAGGSTTADGRNSEIQNKYRKNLNAKSIEMTGIYMIHRERYRKIREKNCT
jgi:hypothetical protein